MTPGKDPFDPVLAGMDADAAEAAALYRRLQRLEPGNPKWHERLGHLYHLQSERRARFARDKATAARAH
jgi:hypothetical protein